MSAPTITPLGVVGIVRPRLRRTAASFAHVAGGEFLLRVATFTVAVVIARQHGANVLGEYATALAAATCVVTVTDNGLQLAAIQRISTSSGLGANIEYSRLIFSKAIVSAFAVLVLAAIGALAWPARATWVLWSLVALRTILQSFAQLNFSALKALQSASAISRVQTFHFVALAGVTWIAFAERSSVVTLLALVAACQAGELLAAAVFIRRQGLVAQRVAIRDCIALLRDSLPVGVTSSVAAFVLRADVVWLAMFFPKAMVGQYAAAQWPIIAVYVVSWLFGSIALSDMMQLDEDHLHDYVVRWSRLSLLLTIPATALGYLVAPVVIRTFFGSQFEGAASIAAVLLLAVPFLFLNTLYLNHAIARRDARVYGMAYVVTMALASALVLASARWLPISGVAVVATLREIGLYLVLRTAARRGAQ